MKKSELKTIIRNMLIEEAIAQNEGELSTLENINDINNLYSFLAYAEGQGRAPVKSMFGKGQQARWVMRQVLKIENEYKTGQRLKDEPKRAELLEAEYGDTVYTTEFWQQALDIINSVHGDDIKKEEEEIKKRKLRAPSKNTYIEDDEEEFEEEDDFLNEVLTKLKKYKINTATDKFDEFIRSYMDGIIDGSFVDSYNPGNILDEYGENDFKTVDEAISTAEKVINDFIDDMEKTPASEKEDWKDDYYGKKTKASIGTIITYAISLVEGLIKMGL
jgi:hypothetical protein